MNSLVTNLRVFWQGTILSYIALFHWLEPVTYLASKVLMPLAQILFFTLLGTFATGRDTTSFYVIGNAIQIAAVSGIYGVTMSIGGDRWNGTLPYLFGTPANRMALFVGRAFIHVIDGMLGVVIGLLWGTAVLGLDLSQANLPALALTILVTTFSTSGLGLLMGCLSLITLNVMFVNNTVYFALLIFSGANIPLASLPPWMLAVSQALPLTRGIAAARQIIAGAGLADVGSLLAGEFLIGCLYVLVGYRMFRWFEYQAKRKGTLETV
ncbi:MAG: ABC transporter permease [Chloroflexi bacterium]|jgi:ABC-2 type transport system permease protein|nr:ABC transporter permease [Chloroflexota bacterium]